MTNTPRHVDPMVALAELCTAQDEYIALLGMEIDDMCRNYAWKSLRMVKADELREKIKQLRIDKFRIKPYSPEQWAKILRDTPANQIPESVTRNIDAIHAYAKGKTVCYGKMSTAGCLGMRFDEEPENYTIEEEFEAIPQIPKGKDDILDEMNLEPTGEYREPMAGETFYDHIRRGIWATTVDRHVKASILREKK